jgi:putative SOS response-associated peptidase YedK
MCSRYFLDADGNIIAYAFRVPVDERIARRANIAPTQEAPVIRATRDKDGREVALLRWGLVPFWAADPTIGRKLINARSETAAAKPAFREAFRARRCAIPASGFFEWTGAARQRVPHAITVPGRPVVAFAGLWERWKDAAGTKLETYTILTTAANAFIAPMHDRMPAILAEEDLDAWLAGTPEQAAQVIRPYPDAALRERAVSPAINDPRYETGDPAGLELGM